MLPITWRSPSRSRRLLLDMSRDARQGGRKVVAHRSSWCVLTTWASTRSSSGTTACQALALFVRARQPGISVSLTDFIAGPRPAFCRRSTNRWHGLVLLRAPRRCAGRAERRISSTPASCRRPPSGLVIPGSLFLSFFACSTWLLPRPLCQSASCSRGKCGLECLSLSRRRAARGARPAQRLDRASRLDGVTCSARQQLAVRSLDGAALRVAFAGGEVGPMEMPRSAATDSAGSRGVV